MRGKHIGDIVSYRMCEGSEIITGKVIFCGFNGIGGDYVLTHPIGKTGEHHVYLDQILEVCNHG